MRPEDSLRELYQQATAGADREGCPSRDQLAALAAGGAAGRDRGRILDHVASCNRCAREVQALRRLEPRPREVANELEPGAGVPRPAARFRRRHGLLAAGLVAVALGGTTLLNPRSPAPAAGVVRSAAEAAARPAPDSRLEAAPAELSWPPQQGATGYRVRLFDAGAQVLWDGEPVAAPAWQLPPAARENLLPGRSYFWTVDIEGSVRRRSLGPFWFHLEASS